MSLGEETEGAALGRRLHQESPALNLQPVVLEAIAGEALGEIVGTLATGFDLDCFKFGVMLPEPVPLYQEVLGATGDPMVGREVEGRLVVFKDSGMDGRANVVIDRQGGD